MSSVADFLFTSRQMRLCEQDIIQNHQISADELMLRAGQSALNYLRKRFPGAKHLAVYCGSGNNAGDGFTLARLAHEQGYSVVIYQYKSIDDLPDVAHRAALQAISANVVCQSVDEPIEEDTDLIVDALLGIGLVGEVRPSLATVINQLNDSNLPILSLDVPSGLNSDTGKVMGACIKADVTVSFIINKIGTMMLDGPDYCGELIVDDLQLEGYIQVPPPAAVIIEESRVRTLLKPRARNSYKANYGHLLAIGGNLGMPGAIYLAANAALRVGAGLVTIATRPEHATYCMNSLPEAMVFGIDDINEFLPLLAKATVCLIGPGLAEDEWAVNLFNQVIVSQLPMVIDASALHILAKNQQYDDNWVLTPHPGEAAKLLHCSSTEVQTDRYQAVTTLQQHYGGNVVLKGVGTLIQTDKLETFLSAKGNPGMASPGMGDVLSGVIAGLIAQGLALDSAATLGVLIHGWAGDLAANDAGERGLLASDLMPYLRRLVNNEVR